MGTIIISLIVGIIIGVFKFIPEKYMKYNGKFQQVGVMLLIFSMGASIGANEELIYNLKSMGIKAATFAVSTIIFSTAALYFVSKRFLREEK